MFYVDISYFLTTIQGLSGLFMGTLIMLMGITMVVSSIPLGIIADRYGRRKLLIVGNVLASFVIALFALTVDPILLMLAALIEGISEAAYNASGSALLAEKAGDERRTSAFSLSFFVSNIGFGLGSFAIPLVFVFEAYGMNDKEAHVMLYLVMATLSLAATAFLLKVSESKSLRKAEGIGGLLPRKSWKVLVRYVVTGSIIAFGAGMVVPLMTYWLALMYGVSDAVSGPILGISSFLMGFTTLVVPFLARRVGVVRAIVVTQGLSTVFMLATPFSPNYLIAGGVYIIRSFLMNMSNPLEQSLIMGLVSSDERGAASGISAALWRLPNSISTAIGAGLMQSGALAEPFYIATILYVTSITIFWFAFSSMKLPEEMTMKGV
jgi:MFS family permease